MLIFEFFVRFRNILIVFICGFDDEYLNVVMELIIIEVDNF